MKRLLEQPATDRLTARAQTLLQAVGPTPPSEARAQRVRRALDRAPRPAVARWAPRLALPMTLVAVGAAAASLGSFVAPDAPPEPRAMPRASVPVVSPAPAAVSRTAPAEPTPPAEPARPDPPPRSSARPPAARTMTDVARVHEAARALSQDGDAARALALLEREPVPPGSPLSEEALALRVRASVALRNGREAKLAKAYLSLYPHGRYRDLALRALSEGGR